MKGSQMCARWKKESKTRTSQSSKRRPGRRKQVTGWRFWLFRIVALTVIPAFLFLLLELGLRGIGYGFPTAVFSKCQVNGKASYCENVKFGWRFFPRNIAREPQPLVFPAIKPDNTYRIFVLGASAALGEPDPAFGFARFLCAMLREMYPAVNFEIINTAMTAINSHVVLEIAEDCAQHEPDLFVVYLGNNEVVGPYGAGTVFAPLSASLSFIHFDIALKTTRIEQMLTNLLGVVSTKKDIPKIWRGLKMFLKRQIPADDSRLKTVYQHFEQNLKDIRRIACKSGAQIIFCTVGSNLKACPPFASLHRPSLTDMEKKEWDEIYQQGVAQETAGKYAKAVELYLSAAEIDDCYADLQFRLGRCFWAMDKYNKAQERFVRARDLDTLRFRADTQINRIVREIADKKTKEGVYLVDAVKVFEKNSPHETPGEEFFYEHVHMNFNGNYLLAKAIFERAEEIFPEWVRIQKADERLLLTNMQCAKHLAYTCWDQYTIQKKVLNGFIKKAPFTNQLYHEELVGQMEQTVKDLKANLTVNALQEVSAQYRRVIQNDSKDWYFHCKYGKLLAEDLKDYRSAAEQAQLAQNSIPHSYLMYNALGSILRAADDLDAATTNYLTAIRIKPTCGNAHYDLGQIYQKQGKTKKAIKHYLQAISLLPDKDIAYNNLAEMFYQQGKIDKAIEICRKGLMFVPDSYLLHFTLGLLLNKQGHRDAALKEFYVTVELEPNSTVARKVLESMLKGSPKQ